MKSPTNLMLALSNLALIADAVLVYLEDSRILPAGKRRLDINILENVQLGD